MTDRLEEKLCEGLMLVSDDKFRKPYRCDIEPNIRDIPKPTPNSSNYKECPKNKGELIWIDWKNRCPKAPGCTYSPCEYNSTIPTWN